MSGGWILCVTLLGGYAAVNIGLSLLIVLLWYAGLERCVSRAVDIVAMRLVPGAGALLMSVAVVLPAFLDQEPSREGETPGLLICGLAFLTLLMVGDALRRGWGAWRATRDLKRSYRVRQFTQVQGHPIGIVDIREPVVMVVGACRPQIIAARSVIAACSPLEFRLVVAHEMAHVSARDNLKFVFLLLSTDVLAWLPLHSVLIDRWRMAAEFAADQRAGTDQRDRVALASALIKVSRLGLSGNTAHPALCMPMASGANCIEARVRLLLMPRVGVVRGLFTRWLTLSALLPPLCACPFYGRVQQLIEILVAYGS
jgi:hypothetical protein